jgi:alkylation response protein AidB-like acyl-CoA dehydrogenase
VNAAADLCASERAEFKTFVDRHVRARAEQFDAEERIPASVIEQVAEAGYLGYALPANYGGGGNGLLAWGFLNEEFGRGCSSLRSLLTVHGMVCHALLRWAGDATRARWLPRLAAGRAIGAFALSEPNSGSDAHAIEATVRAVDGGFVLDGRKKWISFGQTADVLLVFARCNGQPAAFLVERAAAGVEIVPVRGLLGLRGSMVADMRLDGCRVDATALVGGMGLGLHVAGWALDLGRYSVAWGCVGIAQGCVETSVRYANERRQSGALLKDHQLVRRMMTEMIVNVRAARLLCVDAGRLQEARDPRAMLQTSIAKYFSARAAARAARDAVQIHGANGCTAHYPVARYFRDAKIMEIIEGSDEIHQLAIAASTEVGA